MDGLGCRLSVVIPNRNGEKTIGLCLEALFRSNHDSFEVIVVDDASTDGSVAIIEQFPCRLIRMARHSGASAARNAGARQSMGRLLFFTDADCLVREDTLQYAERAAREQGPGKVIGGTYTLRPYDQSFFSVFQSVFIHYCELKHLLRPDYIAAHAMVIEAEVFKGSGGFPEDFLPIIEDVEFSHRLRRNGHGLVMAPELQVRHVFGYDSMWDSIRNGFVKSRYWTMYSLGNRDLLSDSGTASFELKMNVLVLFSLLCLAAVNMVFSHAVIPAVAALLLLGNLLVNVRLLGLFSRAGKNVFWVGAALYYMFVYPFAVGAGTMAGMLEYAGGRKRG